MSVIGEVLAELWSMFVGDRRLTFLLLVVVALAAATAHLLKQPALAGWVILIGAVAVLADAIFQAARRAKG